MKISQLSALYTKAKLDSVLLSFAAGFTVLYLAVVFVIAFLSRPDAFGEVGKGYTAAGLATESFLVWLEGFNITADFMLFMFWSVIGLVIYELLVATQSIIQGIRDEDDLISGRYVRPPGMTKQAIVRHELRRVALFFGSGLFVIASVATVAILLPVSTVAMRELATVPNIATAKDAAILALGLVGAVLVTVFVARLFRHRDMLLTTS